MYYNLHTNDSFWTHDQRFHVITDQFGFTDVKDKRNQAVWSSFSSSFS